ncbi:MAG: Ldh family oxidoreductase [SAR202 cluster bacterium]|nr:Ldh family oxidoreductase [SAR202 cluster bacterium]
MLQRFKVPKDDEVRVAHDALAETVTSIFEKMGVPADDAALGAEVLVATDLRGVETHGVSNMLRSYVEGFTGGTLNPRPDVQVLRDSPAMAVVNADKGLAVILGPKAMEMAMEKARNVGVGVVTMSNAGHSGAIGHHAMLAAKNDMVGMVATSGGLLVVPTFGAEPRFGTNPIAIAAPACNEPFLLFDAATSAIAGNKLRLADRVGASMMPGWIAGLDGAPIMDEVKLPERGQFFQLPLGGTREQGSHKGYGFALMAETLATMLTGDLPTMVEGSRGGSHHYFAAYNIEAFCDLDVFKDNMDQMLATLKATKPAPGHDAVIYPGVSEHEEEKERRQNGIPLHPEVIEWFSDITAELSLPALPTM